MTPKEVISLESDLLNFTLRCYPGQMDNISHCLGVCVTFLEEEDTHSAIVSVRQNTNPINGQEPILTTSGTRIPLNEAAIDEIEKLISIPLDSYVALL